ncbi:hypothetical protein BJ741DRAFT_589110 [Chytriomyces cf. hyalinus JEL632]|nr:hypothetical protein BJ741DRAFT_589110 [Chytriomyces cf. hyalinus JEL632]
MLLTLTLLVLCAYVAAKYVAWRKEHAQTYNPNYDSFPDHLRSELLATVRSVIDAISTRVHAREQQTSNAQYSFLVDDHLESGAFNGGSFGGGGMNGASDEMDEFQEFEDEGTVIDLSAVAGPEFENAFADAKAVSALEPQHSASQQPLVQL